MYVRTLLTAHSVWFTCGTVYFFSDRIDRTVHIDTFTVDIEERGVKLKLTVVDTPGFGDAVDNSEW